ncbi:hypothetical protein [Nocardia arizonensis]|uniref:hypothetical protein n=1 Tax=Nocardia arizonensis TaxID=1141647 RepID=UPI0006D09E9E|nr:hypothetical protein [Nocardia arizonensis]
MSEVVLVHGIAQENRDAHTLETRWTPALAGGVRSAGDIALAQRLWSEQRGAGDVAARMAFYGGIFRTPGAQGGGAGDELTAAQMELAVELGIAWLEAASHRAPDDVDRAHAALAVNALTGGKGGAQGPFGVIGRRIINSLAELQWFAVNGFAFASNFVWRALSQVTRYLTEDDVRAFAQQQVLDLIGPETRLVIAHSLGSVVAYEALHRVRGPVHLVTIGSPLALETIIYPRLRPQPPHVPRCVESWTNIADEDDLVAARLDLAGYFEPAPGRTVAPVTPDDETDNGFRPHDARRYLRRTVTGAAVITALTTPPAPL